MQYGQPAINHVLDVPKQGCDTQALGKSLMILFPHDYMLSHGSKKSK